MVSMSRLRVRLEGKARWEPSGNQAGSGLKPGESGTLIGSPNLRVAPSGGTEAIQTSSVRMSSSRTKESQRPSGDQRKSPILGPFTASCSPEPSGLVIQMDVWGPLRKAIQLPSGE